MTRPRRHTQRLMPQHRNSRFTQIPQKLVARERWNSVRYLQIQYSLSLVGQDNES